MVRTLMDYLDREKVDKREWEFYALVMAAAGLFELSNQAGLGVCTFLPVVFVFMFISFKYIFQK